ncbi:MAG: hypothetical protein Q7U56_08640, partial [Humidesulfovibrio sp.]|nr:hypothetical protein [Humidesulfovibrio sp.]
MNREDAEFSPVENCGGIIEFHIEVENGVKRYSMEYLTNSIYPAGLYGVYAFVSQGRPVSA